MLSGGAVLVDGHCVCGLLMALEGCPGGTVRRGWCTLSGDGPRWVGEAAVCDALQGQVLLEPTMSAFTNMDKQQEVLPCGDLFVVN